MYKEQAGNRNIMNPLVRHDLVVCPVCGAGRKQPCHDRDRVHNERIWRAINRWFADYHDALRQVPCPVPSCGADVGQVCQYPNDNPHRYSGAGLYGTQSHRSRIKAAERTWREVA